ncbi:MAG: DegT/DnrJ/EryC1/StrS family aminotransferase [Lentisphaerae bacterium]|nr:DegT/DnrJ/EryC1/StrS family aminotransferase [Lentisphaerota bacterium]
MGKSTLAIKGGKRVIPAGMQQKWPPVDDVDRQMVLASLEGKNHAFGPNCTAFEQEFAAWNGNPYAITTNSGTAALHMGVVACGCGTGDEIIVPAYSWSSSATCILHHSCIPVFVDIDFSTINIDVTKIERAITPRTKAIIVVHLHGLPVAMEPVLAIARKHKLKVIEDACQAHGATYKGRKVGTWGDCGAFSFNQNKCLCSGEGGMFVTNSEEMLNKARQLWSFGETATPTQKRDYHVYAMGWMYRNNDLTAAFGRSQLTKLDGFLKREIENAQVLTEQLRGVPGLILPMTPPDCGHNYYNYTIRFDMEALGHAHDASDYRYKLIAALQAEGLETGVWQSFVLPAMTVFQAKDGFGHGHPWSSPHAGPVNYDVSQYPQAQKHCDRHTGMTTPLRAPNGAELAMLVAEAIRKVMENADQV